MYFFKNRILERVILNCIISITETQFIFKLLTYIFVITRYTEAKDYKVISLTLDQLTLDQG